MKIFTLVALFLGTESFAGDIHLQKDELAKV